jgi:hypothetical protein
MGIDKKAQRHKGATAQRHKGATAQRRNGATVKRSNRAPALLTDIILFSDFKGSF